MEWRDGSEMAERQQRNAFVRIGYRISDDAGPLTGCATTATRVETTLGIGDRGTVA